MNDTESNLKKELDIDQIEEVEYKKYRKFKNPILKTIWNINLSLIPIIGILYITGVHQKVGLSLYPEQYIGLFLGLVLCAVYVSIPAGKHASKMNPSWYDWILSALGLSAGLYIFFFYPTIVTSMGNVTTDRFVISVIAILLIMEAIRRLLGKGLLIVVLVFLFYGYFAPYFPGIFQGSSTPIDQLFNYMFLDSNSLLSLLNIAATIALSFIIFGQILLHFGGADILNNFAISAFGRFRGGPAKGSILGSSLMGTITGGPVANVLLTGSVTIPLMKKNGYSSAEAGAIESVASTGGQIMPPVMGVAAFIIAETLGVPYVDVALAALIPAFLFYFSLFFQVDFMAGRKGIKRMKKKDIPNMWNVFKKGWMVIPTLASLVYLLFFVGYSPQVSGLYASVVAVVFLAFQKEIRGKMIKLIPVVLVDTGRVMLDISIVLSAAGLIVGITGITGLGFNLGLILTSFAENGLFFLLVASAIVSVILGMGMPSVAAYALVAVLVAPTLVDLGIDPMSAHLFVFYFAIVSNFTPPVAMACFTAAPIAKEDPTRISLRAMKLGLVAYVVPFIFIYAPELLLSYDNPAPWSSTIITIITTIFACYLLAAGLEGFLYKRLNIIKRIVFILLAAGLFIPISVWEYSWILNVVATIIGVSFILKERSGRNENISSNRALPKVK